MQLIARPLAALAIALAIASGACATPVPRVARGEAVTTGNTTYDDFFQAVKQVRSEALAAANDEDATHAGLVKALGLEPKTARALAVDESGVRSKRFQEKGVLLHLEVAPEIRLLVIHGKIALGPDGDGLIKSMEEAAKGAYDMQKRFTAVAARAAELLKRRIDLRGQAPAAFRQDAQAKRDEIIAELDAAKGVLDDALEKANASSGASARFVVELAQAVETGAADSLLNPKNAKSHKKSFASSHRPAHPSSHHAAAAPPKPAAKPASAGPAKPPPAKPSKPKKPGKKAKGGGDDFEP